jgi:hypothetical protein
MRVKCAGYDPEKCDIVENNRLPHCVHSIEHTKSYMCSSGRCERVKKTVTCKDINVKFRQDIDRILEL